MNITALEHTYHEKNGGNNSNNNVIAAKLIFYVIRYSLLKRVSSLVLTLSCRRSFTCNFYHDMLDQVFRLWVYPDKVLQIVVIDKNSRERVGGPRDRNLLLVDSYQTFLDANIISSSSENNFNEYNYIFLHIADDLVKSHLQQILEYCWAYYLIRCNVQVQNEQGEVFVYSYYRYTAGHCGKVVPVIINRYNGTYFENPKLFPKTVHNLHQCPLRAAVWNEPPFLVLSTNGNKTSITGGFEGKLILELASLLNFTIEVKTPPNNEQRGKIFGNTMTGALKMLNDRTADFSLGAFRQTVERDQVVSYTMDHFHFKQAFVALSSAYDLSSWQILVFPFYTSTWLLILLTLSLATLKAFFAKRLYKQCSIYFHHYDTKNCYIDIFSTFIGIPASNIPWTIRGRILLVNWLYFSLIIRTVYQALIFHQVTTRVENELPKTVEELLESNFTAVMIESTSDITQNIPFIKKMQKVILKTNNKFESLSYIEKMKSKKFLALTQREYLMLYAKTHKKPGVFKIVPQNVFASTTTIYMTKHSFLIGQFNEIIMWLNVAGLVEFWGRELLDRDYYKGDNLEIDNVYGMDELHMIFVVYIVGLIMACLVFFFELLSQKYSFLERIFRNAECKST